jgi:hypothetical protein
MVVSTAMRKAAASAAKAVAGKKPTAKAAANMKKAVKSLGGGTGSSGNNTGSSGGKGSSGSKGSSKSSSSSSSNDVFQSFAFPNSNALVDSHPTLSKRNLSTKKESKKESKKEAAMKPKEAPKQIAVSKPGKLKRSASAADLPDDGDQAKKKPKDRSSSSSSKPARQKQGKSVLPFQPPDDWGEVYGKIYCRINGLS